ncbi:hypothetical protein ThidrDRAFT_2310 [Thiorhodococcus drewsii AZ1]|uniref:DUF4365 domain-containing protein n=1 Tax=Thiorhodococcus drewsii AZ1 TaxID=765913 RepID=G2E1Z7_9GAMM|nr:DUF4365 domain-containing protein [Thiorhodococcus drewsii]EGV30946.1 hypothetical protein ThidrDRAFT_2310 [Thiorhodococcus drewsii AZ1]
MHSNDRKARFSLAYINAVAAYAGFDVVEPKVDIDSVDGMLLAHQGRRPRLEFQAKATARDLVGDEVVTFPLPMKNYNDLRMDVIIPRLLILVVLPECEEDWLSHSEDALIIRHCGYWLSLAGAPERENSTSVTVRIPRAQRFTPEMLRTMMSWIEAKGCL